ncbi:MAG TPA: hypothetical protein VGF79_08470, partial [Bacteroidia bacterium]
GLYILVMNDLSITENKLNELLKVINDLKMDTKPENIKYPDNISEMERQGLLNTLVNDGYISYAASLGMYKGNTTGNMFLKSGGYGAKRKKEDELYELTIKSIKLNEEAIGLAKESLSKSDTSIRISNKNTNWVIASVIVTVFLFLLQKCSS